MRIRKGKAAASTSKSAEVPKKTMASKPVKIPKKSVVVGPKKSWSKVVAPVSQKKSLKRKTDESNESDYEAEKNVEDIRPPAKKMVAGKKVPPNVPDAPLDNVSFHLAASVEKWKYVYQRRLVLERELGKEALANKELMEFINEAGLIKSVSGFGSCYEKLVKEFIVNIPKDCDNPLSKEYMKVFVRGRCVELSPEVINRYMGRSEEPQAEVEVSDNMICKEITGN